MISISLQNQSLMRVCGKDARTFLQNICSNDVRLLQKHGDVSKACFLNNKGQLIAFAFMLVLQVNDQEQFLLVVDCEDIESLHKHVLQYRFRSKVNIDVLDQSEACFLFDAFLDASKSDSVFELCPNLYLDVSKIETQLQTGAGKPFPFGKKCQSPFDSTQWQKACFDLGWPQWGVDMSEGDLPMICPFYFDALSYSKGCYLGQETVARVHSRGNNVAWQMHRLKCQDETFIKQYKSMQDEFEGKIKFGTCFVFEDNVYAFAKVHRSWQESYLETSKHMQWQNFKLEFFQ